MRSNRSHIDLNVATELDGKTLLFLLCISQDKEQHKLR